MAETLTGKRVALLVADGFEQVELTEPKRALEQAGATAQIVSPADGRVRGWQHTDWGDAFDVDVPLDSAIGSDFDALVLPGGVMNPDALRQNEKAVNFVRGFFDQNKPVAAICHGGWTLAEADVLQGRRVTSYPSIQTDLKNAGAVWVDEEVVDDNGLITSRNPNDLPAFTAKLIEKIAAG
ncbi:type 1 glutamine amidotransferase domain-containing protein [Guyparkeria sp.]|uniref:type 1 glutamine amidotransferase domain-containing protein n=1 Tax=Guyparkeria sp. TaxID=2035736 RepID=UPI00356A293A